jgi:hypothetical protein
MKANICIISNSVCAPFHNVNQIYMGFNPYIQIPSDFLIVEVEFIQQTQTTKRKIYQLIQGDSSIIHSSVFRSIYL